jgi:hypothetical protein
MIKHYLLGLTDVLMGALFILGLITAAVALKSEGFLQATEGMFMITTAVWYMMYRFARDEAELYKQQLDDEVLSNRVIRVDHKLNK